MDLTNDIWHQCIYSPLKLKLASAFVSNCLVKRQWSICSWERN